MWDEIRAAHPHLAIDNCASGGRRIDLETCTRSIPLWRSDNTCDMLDLSPATVQLAAIKNQVMTAGLSRYVPFSTCGQMGATPYLFRSGFNAGISFCEDCRPAKYPREALRKAIAEGKRLRKYYFGNLYTLSEVTTGANDWCVLQYHCPAEQDGMVVAFRRHESPYFGLSAELREIEFGAEYEVVRSVGYEPTHVRGTELQHSRLEILDRPGSIILEYKRAKP
jgi:alpha-galactosidase